MHLLLIAPAREEALGIAGRRMSIAPPLNLGIVAALTPPDWQVRILDENLEPLDFNIKTDLVGITATTRTINRAYEIAAEFRRRGMPVVLGGIHPSTLPEEAIAHASAVVIGEAENTWSSLLRDLENGQLQKIYRSSTLAAMDQIPVPRRDLFAKKNYITVDTVTTTRGCPYSCSFCTVTKFFGHTYRLRPIDTVMNEIDALGVKTVYFLDDNIAGHPKYARELFRALIPRKLKWAGQASLAIARDQELLDLAAASGCMGLFIGFESVDDNSLRAVGKKANAVCDYEDAVRRLHRAGIAIFGAFIFGFDEDDEDVFERTVRFARGVKLEGAQFNTLTPYPGTTIFADLERQGRILTKDWSKYDMSEVVYVPKQMSAATLRAGHDWAWQEFYSLPSIINRIGVRWHNLPLLLLLNFGYRQHWRKKRHLAPDLTSDEDLASNTASEPLSPPQSGRGAA